MDERTRGTRYALSSTPLNLTSFHTNYSPWTIDHFKKEEKQLRSHLRQYDNQHIAYYNLYLSHYYNLPLNTAPNTTFHPSDRLLVAGVEKSLIAWSFINIFDHHLVSDYNHNITANNTNIDNVLIYSIGNTTSHGTTTQYPQPIHFDNMFVADGVYLDQDDTLYANNHTYLSTLQRDMQAKHKLEQAKKTQHFTHLRQTKPYIDLLYQKGLFDMTENSERIEIQLSPYEFWSSQQFCTEIDCSCQSFIGNNIMTKNNHHNNDNAYNYSTHTPIDIQNVSVDSKGQVNINNHSAITSSSNHNNDNDDDDNNNNNNNNHNNNIIPCKPTTPNNSQYINNNDNCNYSHHHFEHESPRVHQESMTLSHFYHSYAHSIITMPPNPLSLHPKPAHVSSLTGTLTSLARDYGFAVNHPTDFVSIDNTGVHLMIQQPHFGGQYTLDEWLSERWRRIQLSVDRQYITMITPTQCDKLVAVCKCQDNPFLDHNDMKENKQQEQEPQQQQQPQQQNPTQNNCNNNNNDNYDADNNASMSLIGTRKATDTCPTCHNVYTNPIKMHPFFDYIKPIGCSCSYYHSKRIYFVCEVCYEIQKEEKKFSFNHPDFCCCNDCLTPCHNCPQNVSNHLKLHHQNKLNNCSPGTGNNNNNNNSNNGHVDQHYQQTHMSHHHHCQYPNTNTQSIPPHSSHQSSTGLNDISISSSHNDLSMESSQYSHPNINLVDHNNYPVHLSHSADLSLLYPPHNLTFPHALSYQSSHTFLPQNHPLVMTNSVNHPNTHTILPQQVQLHPKTTTTTTTITTPTTINQFVNQNVPPKEQRHIDIHQQIDLDPTLSDLDKALAHMEATNKELNYTSDDFSQFSASLGIKNVDNKNNNDNRDEENPLFFSAFSSQNIIPTFELEDEDDSDQIFHYQGDQQQTHPNSNVPINYIQHEANPINEKAHRKIVRKDNKNTTHGISHVHHMIQNPPPLPRGIVIPALTFLPPQLLNLDHTHHHTNDNLNIDSNNNNNNNNNTNDNDLEQNSQIYNSSHNTSITNTNTSTYNPTSLLQSSQAVQSDDDDVPPPNLTHNHNNNDTNDRDDADDDADANSNTSGFDPFSIFDTADVVEQSGSTSLVNNSHVNSLSRLNQRFVPKHIAQTHEHSNNGISNNDDGNYQQESSFCENIESNSTPDKSIILKSTQFDQFSHQYASQFDEDEDCEEYQRMVKYNQKITTSNDGEGSDYSIDDDHIGDSDNDDDGDDDHNDDIDEYVDDEAPFKFRPLPANNLQHPNSNNEPLIPNLPNHHNVGDNENQIGNQSLSTSTSSMQSTTLHKRYRHHRQRPSQLNQSDTNTQHHLHNEFDSEHHYSNYHHHHHQQQQHQEGFSHHPNTNNTNKANTNNFFGQQQTPFVPSSPTSSRTYPTQQLQSMYQPYMRSRAHIHSNDTTLTSIMQHRIPTQRYREQEHWRALNIDEKMALVKKRSKELISYLPLPSSNNTSIRLPPADGDIVKLHSYASLLTTTRQHFQHVQVYPNLHHPLLRTLPVDMTTGQPLLQTQIEQIYVLNPALKEPFLRINDKADVNRKFKKKYGYDIDLILLLRIDQGVVAENQLIDDGGNYNNNNNNNNNKYKSSINTFVNNTPTQSLQPNIPMGRNPLGLGTTGALGHHSFGTIMAGTTSFPNNNNNDNNHDHNHQGNLVRQYRAGDEADSLRHMLRLHYNDLCYEVLTLEQNIMRQHKHMQKLQLKSKLKESVVDHDVNNHNNLDTNILPDDIIIDDSPIVAPYPIPFPLLSPHLPSPQQQQQHTSASIPHQPTYDSITQYIDNVNDTNLYEYVERERYELAKLGLDHLVPVFYSPLHEVHTLYSDALHGCNTYMHVRDNCICPTPSPTTTTQIDNHITSPVDVGHKHIPCTCFPGRKYRVDDFLEKEAQKRNIDVEMVKDMCNINSQLISVNYQYPHINRYIGTYGKRYQYYLKRDLARIDQDLLPFASLRTDLKSYDNHHTHPHHNIIQSSHQNNQISLDHSTAMTYDNTDVNGNPMTNSMVSSTTGGEVLCESHSHEQHNKNSPINSHSNNIYNYGSQNVINRGNNNPHHNTNNNLNSGNNNNNIKIDYNKSNLLNNPPYTDTNSLLNSHHLTNNLQNSITNQAKNRGSAYKMTLFGPLVSNKHKFGLTATTDNSSDDEDNDEVTSKLTNNSNIQQELHTHTLTTPFRLPPHLMGQSTGDIIADLQNITLGNKSPLQKKRSKHHNYKPATGHNGEFSISLVDKVKELFNRRNEVIDPFIGLLSTEKTTRRRKTQPLQQQVQQCLDEHGHVIMTTNSNNNNNNDNKNDNESINFTADTASDDSDDELCTDDELDLMQHQTIELSRHETNALRNPFVEQFQYRQNFHTRYKINNYLDITNYNPFQHSDKSRLIDIDTINKVYHNDKWDSRTGYTNANNSSGSNIALNSLLLSEEQSKLLNIATNNPNMATMASCFSILDQSQINSMLQNASSQVLYSLPTPAQLESTNDLFHFLRQNEEFHKILGQYQFVSKLTLSQQQQLIHKQIELAQQHVTISFNMDYINDINYILNSNTSTIIDPNCIAQKNKPQTNPTPKTSQNNTTHNFNLGMILTSQQDIQLNQNIAPVYTPASTRSILRYTTYIICKRKGYTAKQANQHWALLCSLVGNKDNLTQECFNIIKGIDQQFGKDDNNGRRGNARKKRHGHFDFVGDDANAQEFMETTSHLIEQIANDAIYGYVDDFLQGVVNGLGLVPNIRANIPTNPLLLA